MTLVLLWALRIIVVLIVLRFVLRAIHSIAVASRPPAARKPAERVGGALVRDLQCGTYIPKERAITVGSGRHVQYFCSPECRDQARRAS